MRQCLPQPGQGRRRRRAGPDEAGKALLLVQNVELVILDLQLGGLGCGLRVIQSRLAHSHFRLCHGCRGGLNLFRGGAVVIQILIRGHLEICHIIQILRHQRGFVHGPGNIAIVKGCHQPIIGENTREQVFLVSRILEAADHEVLFYPKALILFKRDVVHLGSRGSRDRGGLGALNRPRADRPILIVVEHIRHAAELVHPIFEVSEALLCLIDGLGIKQLVLARLNLIGMRGLARMIPVSLSV